MAVVKLVQPRRTGLKRAAHEAVTSATRGVGDLSAVVVIALGRDGSFAHRTVSFQEIADIDMYGRAGALMDRERQRLTD
jgi:hypothetical protein